MSKNENKKANEFETEAPASAARTAKRLFGQLKNQRLRLVVIGFCIVIYTILNVYTPYYSAGVTDRLFAAIRTAVNQKT